MPEPEEVIARMADHQGHGHYSEPDIVIPLFHSMNREIARSNRQAGGHGSMSLPAPGYSRDGMEGPRPDYPGAIYHGHGMWSAPYQDQYGMSELDD